MSIIQEAPLGQLLYFLSKGRLFAYPEDQPGFQIPWENAGTVGKDPDLDTPDEADRVEEKPLEESINPPLRSYPTAISRISTSRSGEANAGLEKITTTSRSLTREQTRPWSAERFEIEQSESLQREHSSIIVPQKTQDGVVLVDWYTTDDPANPQNWNSRKKAFVGLQIFLYTFVVYCTSAIYTPSQEGVMRKFGVSYAKGSLGLSIYVIGYGVGPMVNFFLYQENADSH